MRVLRLGLLAAVLVVLLSCGAGAGTSGPGGMPPGDSGAVASDVAADGRVALVYAAVIRHHLTTALAATVPQVVYVLDRAVPDAADAMRPLDDERGVAIEDRVQQQVAAELAGPVAIRFVASTQAVLTVDQGCSTITEHVVVLILAPVPTSGDRVELGLAELSNACLSGRWQTYVLVRTDAGWSVEGTTGPLVIS
ncbi:MAG TPA: hypothetical protein VGD67_26560 [Pseudonocardiaceae bacterium]